MNPRAERQQIVANVMMSRQRAELTTPFFAFAQTGPARLQQGPSIPILDAAGTVHDHPDFGNTRACTTPVEEGPPPEAPLPPTPWRARLLIGTGVALVGLSAYLLHGQFGYRIQAGAGIICFLGLAAMFSKSLQSVSRKTLLWGIGLQFVLAVAVIHSEYVQAVFRGVGVGIPALIASSDKGAKFVFGDLADPTPRHRTRLPPSAVD